MDARLSIVRLRRLSIGSSETSTFLDCLLRHQVAWQRPLSAALDRSGDGQL